MWTSDSELSMEGLGIATAPARAQRRRTRAGVALGWVRERLTTTPGRLILISILVVLGAVCIGVLATGAEQSRERAVRAARTATEPQLVHAVNLYTALSDANATVATGLLGAGGLEPATARARYLSDIHVATTALTALTRGAGAAASAPTSAVADQLPVYTGLVESARANSRQGFPIGAAYLRQAAALLGTSILPAAEQIYAVEAERLDGDYRTGTATSSLVVLAVAVALALVLLLLAQRYVMRITHRVFNVLMVAATVALAAVSIWAIVGLLSEQDALRSAQHQGSDAVEKLSAASVLLSRAQGDLSLALVNRGTDQAGTRDFDAVMGVLTTRGLADRLQARFAAYDTAAGRIRRLETGGQLTTAIEQAPAVAAVSHQLTGDLDGQIAAAQARFSAHAADAASALDGLALAIPLVTVLVAVLALLGLRQRINEYR